MSETIPLVIRVIKTAKSMKKPPIKYQIVIGSSKMRAPKIITPMDSPNKSMDILEDSI